MNKIFSTKARESSRKGVALIVAVVFLLAIVTVVVLGVSGALVRDLHVANALTSSMSSYYLAESGVEDAYYRLVHDISMSSSYTVPLDGTTVGVSVITPGLNQREIVGTASVDSHTRVVDLLLNTSVSGAVFAYGVQVGAGGITLASNALIEGVGGAQGDVYSNGPIIGGTNATATGNVTVAGGTTVDPTAQSIVCNQDQTVGRTSPQYDFAQSFVPSVSDSLSKVSIYLRKNGNPGDRTIYIVADNSGSPGTTELASGTLNKDLVGTSAYSWIDILMDTPPLLSAGTTYWIVFDAGQSNSNYWRWCKNSSGGAYSGASKYSSSWSGGSWTSNSGDLTFQLYFGAGQSVLEDMVVSGTARANTITDSLVSGDAYYQNISGSTVSGTSYSGSPDSPVLPPPLSDASITAWKAVAESGGVVSGDCPGAVGCSSTMGPVKIDGDLTISGAFVLSGIVHTTGNVTFNSGADMSCDAAFGNDSCILIADGWITRGTGATISGSGSANSHMLLISTKEGCLGDTGSGCASGNSAIYLNGNTTGGLFYASKSLVAVSGSSISSEITGYKVSIGSGATVQYPASLANTRFSTAPGGVWSVEDWGED